MWLRKQKAAQSQAAEPSVLLISLPY